METLLLPGMDGTGDLFAPLVRALPQELRPWVARYPRSTELGYDELLGLLRRPSGPFAIVAESFSGPLAIRLAAEAGDRLVALVLVASFVRSPLALSRMLAPMMGPAWFSRRMPRRAVTWALLGAGAAPELASELHAAIASVAPEVMARRVSEMLSVDVTRALKDLAVPILYVSGRHDRLVRSASLREIRRHAPNVEVSLIDAPHLVLQREPEAAAAVIGKFILAASARRAKKE